MLSSGVAIIGIAMTMEVAFTFEEAVRTLGVTPEKLTKLIEDGKIPVSREGGRTRISRRAILDYLAEVSSVPAIDRSKRR